ncbi:MAG: glycosyltransferase [Pseudomonadales bacterium]|nr:glycosyltransferase [Pseudomonadales bacterium]
MLENECTRRPWVAYVGPFSFPEGGAAARRILGVSKALVDKGYNVAILAGQINGNGSRLEQYLPGIFYGSMQERSAEHLPRAIKLARYVLMGRKTRIWLKKLDAKPDAVILYSGYSPYLFQFTSWCRARNIPIVFDAVEWYTAEDIIQFLRSPYLWNIEFAMRILIKRLDGVIAISSYLRDYYEKANLPVALVPPTLEMGTIDPRLTVATAQKLSLAYCGSPGTKDLLSEVIEAVLEIDDSGQQLVLHVAGPEIADVMGLAPLAPWKGKGPPGALTIHGRVSHDESMDIVRNADFSVFLRNRNRASTAGFPTKFVESLALGTPVITNISSDLCEYLTEGNTGYICSTTSSDGLQNVLKKAMLTGIKQRSTMRQASRKLAELSFDCNRFSDTICSLIQRPDS